MINESITWKRCVANLKYYPAMCINKWHILRMQETGPIVTDKHKYIVLQFISQNCRGALLEDSVVQTQVPKHIWTCSNWRLHELQTPWDVLEAVRVRCILLAEKRVTRIWSSGWTPGVVWGLVNIGSETLAVVEEFECSEWHGRFKEGPEDVQDDPGSVQPTT
jgi:hypothetical protein